MVDDGQLLNGPRLKALLTEVANELPADGPRRRTVIVGGAVMAWNNWRQATRDVDSALRLDNATKIAAAVVASRHGLRPDWLNDAAAGYTPAGFVPDEDRVVLDHPHLLVLEASPDQMFLMKVCAARQVDIPDMRALWPHTSFGTPRDVVEAFRQAYPAEPADPYLETLLADVLGL